jgi:hypothetical protein
VLKISRSPAVIDGRYSQQSLCENIEPGSTFEGVRMDFRVNTRREEDVVVVDMAGRLAAGDAVLVNQAQTGRLGE